MRGFEVKYLSPMGIELDTVKAEELEVHEVGVLFFTNKGTVAYYQQVVYVKEITNES